MSEKELFRNKLYVSSPTSISIGNCTWFDLDTKLVGRIKAMIEENKQLKEQLSNNGLVKTCENCEWFGVCPHSYKEYDYKNIIDELEKWLEEEIKSWTEAINEEHDYVLVNEFALKIDMFKEVINKLQELKGSENNE